MPSAQRATPRITKTAFSSQPMLCVVQLIDRRTDQSLRVNGRPLTVLTRNPELAAADLLAGRDPTIWRARILPIEHRQH